MKVEDFSLLATCIMVVELISLSAPSRCQEQTQGNEDRSSRRKNDSGQFPVLIESRDQDFVVKWRGEMFSWKNHCHLLRQHNITVPQEENILAAVLQQKNSSVQSCQGRCFLDERRHRNKTCFCDKPCKLLSDCCLDFHTRCGHIGLDGLDDTSHESMTCGDINDPSRPSGIIMKSSCNLHNRHTTSDCQSVHWLNMTLQKELPVFDWAQNITYRSIVCARCNNAGNLSVWGIDVFCPKAIGSFPTLFDIMSLKRFLTEHKRCWWKYAPGKHLKKPQYKSCVLRDTQCASNQLPVMSVIKELCSSYSMVFSVKVGPTRVKYRNPHCALCNSGANFRQLPFVSLGPPLSILLDVSSNIVNPKEPTNPQSTSGPVSADLMPQIINCTSSMNDCTVTFGGKRCEVLTLRRNQSLQNRSFLNRSHLVRVKPREIQMDKNTTVLQGYAVYILCPENATEQVDKDLTILIYVTFVGTLLSIISLCLLLSVYLSFKELRNLPGKCLMNLSLALLCYQTIFLCAAKSTEVVALCKAVAIFLHFFILAAFAWMTVMGFDTANTFTVQVIDTRRQPSDISRIFIKYCIVGWGVPAAVVVLCSVVDFTGTFHFGYGNSIYCWISDGRAIAVAMVTPVGLALLFNVICLGKNVHAIRHLQQAANLATINSSQASLTIICTKLTAVMGLTWILGLLANWNQTAFLDYPSTVLNSMQGFFIALCFTTTKKVRGLITKRWKTKGEANIHVPRDQCTRNTEDERATGFFNMLNKNV